MKIRHLLTALTTTAVLFAGSPASAQVAVSHDGAGTVQGRPGPDAERSLTECSAEYLNGDKRLGPLRLPVLGLAGKELTGYQPTNDLGPQRFLDLYWKDEGWVYPAQNGYIVNPDGSPQRALLTFQVGQDIDRYGSERGAFLAPEGTPYAQRAIPPMNLDGDPAAGCNYYDYRVIKEFTVYSGTVAPWFAQPGLGTQYELDYTLIPGAPTPDQGFGVKWLVDNHYLERIISPTSPH
ncbi:TNT domain-containing protein [Kitasatospora sp. NPDC001683]